jgi:uncharacterized protein YjiS (DUF1127 family)
MSLSIQTIRLGRHIELSPVSIWHATASYINRIRLQAALRREVERMDDHMLADIGLSRAQALFEVDEKL